MARKKSISISRKPSSVAFAYVDDVSDERSSGSTTLSLGPHDSDVDTASPSLNLNTVELAPPPNGGGLGGGRSNGSEASDLTRPHPNPRPLEEGTAELHSTALPLGPVGRAIYGTVFCVSYGVVFGAILIGYFIPGSGLIGRALNDGAEAAQGTFKRKPHLKAANLSA